MQLQSNEISHRIPGSNIPEHCTQAKKAPLKPKQLQREKKNTKIKNPPQSKAEMTLQALKRTTL